jgi:hypothetical protein
LTPVSTIIAEGVFPRRIASESRLLAMVSFFRKTLEVLLRFSNSVRMKSIYIYNIVFTHFYFDESINPLTNYYYVVPLLVVESQVTNVTRFYNHVT